MTTNQLRQISDLARIYGTGGVRLTPWRSILLPDVQDPSTLWQQLEDLGFSSISNNIWGGLVACSGTSGCAASFTDTQADALALAQYIENNLTLDRPVTIHFSGCSKSCAHHGSSDLTLVGTKAAIAQNNRTIAGYHLYMGDAEHPFGRLFLSNLKPTQLPAKIAQLLSIYQLRRANCAQSFREFVNQSSLTLLHQWFNEGTE
jgi:ferredoxin-nitrite reductase